MNILVTGGAGFIGSHIVDYLLKNTKYKIKIVDNLFSGSLNNIKHNLKYYPDRLNFIYGDISNLEVCRKVSKNIDLICHQAAVGSVPRSIEDPLTSHNSNINGILNLLIASKENNVKRIVYASSSSVYGDESTLPKVEHKTGNPMSPYAVTKVVQELYCKLFNQCYGVECIGLRYFNVFGPKQNPNGAYAAVIPKFIKKMKNGFSPTINGDGSYSRDFTYIDNVVDANIKALFTTNKKCNGEVFNIGAGGRTTILELFNILKKEFNFKKEPKFCPIRKGDIPHSNANIKKAIDILGWNPKINVEEGLKLTSDPNYYNNFKYAK